MNTIRKNKIFFYFFALCITFVIFCSFKKTKDYEYPLIETDNDMEISLPKYVPQNYKFEEIEISPPFVSVTYSSESGNLYYTQITSPSFSLSLDTENNTITEYNSNKFTGYLLTDTSSKSSYLLSVYNDTNSFEITGNIEKDELFKLSFLPFRFHHKPCRDFLQKIALPFWPPLAALFPQCRLRLCQGS